MFTLHFILLLGFSTLHIAAAENTDPQLLNLRNDSGIVSPSAWPAPSSLNQPLGNEFSEDYDEEELQDNRLRLMLQPKKPLTLNETKLRTWPVNPNVSDNAPVISFRNSFAVESFSDGEISRNEITENISNPNDQENSGDDEIETNFPKPNSTSGETVSALKNKTEETLGGDSQNQINKTNLSSNNERPKTEPDSKYSKVDLTDLAEEENSNSTVVTGKFVAPQPSSKNSIFPAQNDTIYNNTTNQSTLIQKPESQNTPNNTVVDESEQKKGMTPSESISTDTDSEEADFEETTHLPLNSANQTQNLDNDNFYEELEPDILSAENDTDYITLNDTADDYSDTVWIVVPGSNTRKGDKQIAISTSSGKTAIAGSTSLIGKTFPGNNLLAGKPMSPAKPFISESISQNLLHLLMNLTVMTTANQKNGRQILRELQQQKGQLQGLKKQSDNIFHFITKAKNNHPK